MADTPITTGLEYSGLCGFGSVPIVDHDKALDTTGLDFSGLGVAIVVVTAGGAVSAAYYQSLLRANRQGRAA